MIPNFNGNDESMWMLLSKALLMVVAMFYRWDFLLLGDQARHLSAVVFQSVGSVRSGGTTTYMYVTCI